jgi:hypothetical protein
MVALDFQAESKSSVEADKGDSMTMDGVNEGTAALSLI